MKRFASFIVRNASTLAQSLVVVWLGVLWGKAIVPFVVEVTGLQGYAAAFVVGLATSAFSFVAALLLRIAVNRLTNTLSARTRPPYIAAPDTR